MDFELMDELEAALTEAHVTTAALRHAIESDHELEKATLTKRLNELTRRLGLDLWCIDRVKQNDRIALASNLTYLEEILKDTLAQYPTQANLLANEQVVASVSGGAALCGVRLGAVAWTGHMDGLIVERSCTPLLAAPQSCNFTEPLSPVLRCGEMFATIQDATDFREMMKSCGWSMAQACRASANGGKHERPPNLPDDFAAEPMLTTSAALVTCIIVPAQSFHLDLGDMRLSLQASAAAASIVDAKSALAFLREFGSHVTCGVHDVGGIYLKTVEITTKDPTSVQDLHGELENRSSDELSLGYGPFGFGLNGYKQVNAVEPSSDWMEAQTSDVTTHLETIGPVAPSFKIFQEKLASNCNTWELIDRPCRDSMVGVWELMAKVDGCKQAADLVRRTWIDQVEPLSGVPEIKHVIDRARAFGPHDSVGVLSGEVNNKEDGGHYSFVMPSAASVAASVPFSTRPASEQGGLTYNHLLTVGPKPDRETRLRDLIWYTIKHRLDIEEELYPSKLVAGKGLVKKGATKAVSKPAQPVVLDALLGLIKSLDVTAKTEVCRLLLDRRFLVPFLIPREDQSRFTSEAHVLKFINTAIADGVGGTSTACLMRDCNVLRVAVVSDRETGRSATSDWIKNVFHVQSIHCLDRVHGSNVTALDCVAEIGWGFLKRDGKYSTVMVLHVIGKYYRLNSFLEQFADALVVDVGQSSTPVPPYPIQRGCLIKWQGTLVDEDSMDESEEGAQVTSILMRCTAQTSSTLITEYLLEYGESQARAQVDKVAEMCGLEPSNPSSRLSADKVCSGIRFDKIRLAELKMQRNFLTTSKLLIDQQRDTGGDKYANYTDMIQNLKATNAAIARDVYHHPLIRLFVQALENPSAVEREMAILDLEHHLAAASEQASRSARAQYRTARDAFNRSKNPKTQKGYVDALEHWGLTVTGREHLWRELSHVYVANPNAHQLLPEHAVTHLLDGFSIELMDGDAAMVNLTWITAIFNRLEGRLSNARIFVLSIIGVQSSGKSTLLNYMFGVRLPTSVSRCTRGVSIQLLKCDGRTQYDYILLLDTEGIRSPEYDGTEDSVWRDNRMATLAILPADATIILTKGESTVTINEMLPIVLSVFLDSALVQEHREELPSKFYFVFNQIDTAQSTNMETIVDTLLENLGTNAKKIEAIRGNRSSQVESSTEYFTQFQVDINNESASDVRFLGTIKGSTDPPLDTPLSDYGKRALAFRDYIHDRASDQPCRRISDVYDRLALVWDCINKANFQLNFIAAHERLSHDELVRVMTRHKQELARAYSTAFDKVLQRICDDNTGGARVDAGSSTYENDLRHGVHDAVLKLDASLQVALAEEKFSKWRLDHTTKWDQHKADIEAHMRRLVRDKVNQVFLYDTHVAKYQQMLHQSILDRFNQAKASDTAFDLTDDEFDNMFGKLLVQVQMEHPPFAQQIPRLIDDLFDRGNLFVPQQVDPNTPWYNPVKIKKNVKSALGFNASSELPETSMQENVQEFVVADLEGVRRYCEDKATECILRAKTIIGNMKLSNEMYKTAVGTLRNAMKECFYDIQTKWDEENSVAAKFATR